MSIYKIILLLTILIVSTYIGFTIAKAIKDYHIKYKLAAEFLVSLSDIFMQVGKQPIEAMNRLVGFEPNFSSILQKSIDRCTGDFTTSPAKSLSLMLTEEYRETLIKDDVDFLVKAAMHVFDLDADDAFANVYKLELMSRIDHLNKDAKVRSRVSITLSIFAGLLIDIILF